MRKKMLFTYDNILICKRVPRIELIHDRQCHILTERVGLRGPAVLSMCFHFP